MSTEPSSEMDAALRALRAAAERETSPSLASAVMAKLPAPGDAGVVLRLVTGISRDEAAKKRLRAAPTQQEFLDSVVALGRERGLAFSALAVRQSLAACEAANDGELNDTQLEAVAGGGQELKTWLELYARLPSGNP